VTDAFDGAKHFFRLNHQWSYNSRMLNELEITGRARTHVLQCDDLRAALHRDVVAPFRKLKAAAADAGIEIEITSSFRDFAAQQKIWDRKFRGERPLYDAHGSVRDHGSLSEVELVSAIVCWSAVPGSSRHHWGTDIDVIDRAATPRDYVVRLLPDEAAPGGVFQRLHEWLDENMARFGFFRPYRQHRGGVFPEPWHLSYAPIAIAALGSLTLEVLEDTVRASTILGKDAVLARIGEIYRHYVVNVDGPDSALRQVAGG